MVICFRKNKLTMFGGPSPLNSLDQLAESKVKLSYGAISPVDLGIGREHRDTACGS